MSSIVNKRVINNFFALIILQGGNYLLPLILIPFLTRALGMETFGDWVFAVSFVVFFRTFVSYGFDLTATRSVSVHRNDKTYVGKLFATVVITRLAFFVLSCILLLGLTFLSTNIANVQALALLSMLVLIGEAFFPVWLFQGMEDMAVITKLRLGYRALFVLIVILLVSESHDVFLIPIIEAVGSLGAGLIATRLAVSRYSLKMRLPDVSFIKREVKDGASVFVSNIAVHFYTTINTILLGVMVGSVAVAQYSIADKVYYAFRGMLGPVVQVLFPSLSRLCEEDFDAFKRASRNITVAILSGLIAMALLTYFIADPFVLLIAGESDPVSIQVLQILSISMVFGLGTFFSPLLVIRKKGNVLVRITLLTMLVNLILVFPLIYYFGVIGMAMAFFFSQLFQLIAQFIANADVVFIRATDNGAEKSRSDVKFY